MTEKQDPSKNDRPMTILVLAMSCCGTMNECIGISDILRRRGHRVVILTDPTWKNKLASIGLEAYIVEKDEAKDKDSEDLSGGYYERYMQEALPKFRQPAHVQLETFIGTSWHMMIDEAKFYNHHLPTVIDRIKPDVIFHDTGIGYPGVVTSGIPYVRIVSCNPLEIPGQDVPPAYSGLPQDDRSNWDAFRTAYDRFTRPVWKEYSTWVQLQGAPSLPDLHFIHDSKYANLYIYPKEVDYIKKRPLGPTWHRMDSSVRETDVDYILPSLLRNRPSNSSLVYASLGTLGCYDVELMQRLIDVLSQSRHYFILNKGPLGDRLKLFDNMVGEAELPQTKVIPQVDLVVTHGGNNTVTECLHFGKPMIILPLFWDQHDNAQRMHEFGFGIRMNTYGFTDKELLTALDNSLNDTELRHRMTQIGEQIRQRNGVRLGADIIEKVGRKFVTNRTQEKQHA